MDVEDIYYGVEVFIRAKNKQLEIPNFEIFLFILSFIILLFILASSSNI